MASYIGVTNNLTIPGLKPHTLCLDDRFSAVMAPILRSSLCIRAGLMTCFGQQNVVETCVLHILSKLCCCHLQKSEIARWRVEDNIKQRTAVLAEALPE